MRQLIIFLSFALIWWILSSSIHSVAVLFSTPLRFAYALVTELQTLGFWMAIANSCMHVCAGVIIGTLLGNLLAIVSLQRNSFGEIACALEKILRPIPPLACIPIGILLFGVSASTAIFVVAFGIVWTVLVTTREAICAVPQEILELGFAYGYRPSVSRFIHITLPAALPGIFAGVKTAVGQGWTLVVAAELAGVEGIGQRLWQASGVLASDYMMVSVFTLALLNVVTNSILNRLGSKVFPWRQS